MNPIENPYQAMTNDELIKTLRESLADEQRHASYLAQKIWETRYNPDLKNQLVYAEQQRKLLADYIQELEAEIEWLRRAMRLPEECICPGWSEYTPSEYAPYAPIEVVRFATQILKSNRAQPAVKEFLDDLKD